MMKLLKGFALGLTMIGAATSGVSASADDYTIDTRGAHAFVQFRVKHLGYSWLYGRFNDFEGEFSYDEKNPAKNKVNVEVDMTSVDSNHAERDKHVRSGDFLNVDKYASASFTSTRWEDLGDGKAKLYGDLSFFGSSNEIVVDVEHIGGGSDPWGGWRQGFEGRAVIEPAKWGLDLTKKLGPATQEVELLLTVEGIRKKDLRPKK